MQNFIKRSFKTSAFIAFVLADVSIYALQSQRLMSLGQRAVQNPGLTVNTARALSSVNAVKLAAQTPQKQNVQPAALTPRAVEINTSASSAASGKQSWREWQKKFKTFDWQRNVIPLAIGAAAITALNLLDAGEIADTAYASINILLFDQDLIPGEFSDAIVRVYSNLALRYIGYGLARDQGSGTIIRGKYDPNFYYVLTAAHCIFPQKGVPLPSLLGINYSIELQNNKHSHRLYLEPIIIDRERDIAVLRIIPQDVIKYQAATKASLPAISVDDLSSIAPKRNEAVLLQGYPGFLPQEQLKPYSVRLAAHKQKIWKIMSVDDSGEEVPMQWPGTQFKSHDITQKTSGASGGPLIAIRDNRPQVVGIHSAGYEKVIETPLFSLKRHKTFGVGGGDLPEYLERAEKCIN